jgi:hypothetical protein
MPTLQRTTPRLQGEMFIVALEVVSLYLQRNDECLAKKFGELDPLQRRMIYRTLGMLYYHLGERL